MVQRKKRINSLEQVAVEEENSRNSPAESGMHASRERHDPGEAALSPHHPGIDRGAVFSGEVYKSLVEFSSDIMYLSDNEGNHLYMNQAGYRALETSPEEVIGKPWLTWVHPDDRTKATTKLHEMMHQGGDVFDLECRYVSTGGKEIHLLHTVHVLRTPAGAPRGTQGTARDITGSIIAEKELQESEEKFVSLVQTASDAIICIDTRSTITFWNRSAESIFGYTAQEAIGSDLSIIIPERFRQAHRLGMDRFSATETSKVNGKTIELTGLRKSGEEFPLELSIAVWTTRTGSFVTGIIRDITERKKMEAQILRSMEDWEDTFDTITDMITIHDKDFNIIRANKAARKVLSLPFLREGKLKCFQYYHGEDSPPPECPNCRCLETGMHDTFEVFEPHLNMHIEIQVIPRRDSNNQLIGLVHVARDISDRKRLEEELYRAQQAEREKKQELEKAYENLTSLFHAIEVAKNEWESTMDCIDDMVLLIDHEGRIQRCNKAVGALSGKSYQELVGSDWKALLAENGIAPPRRT
ncbi:MAG: PAS domain S-box protein [Alphaproteobacteria bacterium]|uniref:PAS domain S-box protein n=1 Tax=Candidatus Nitrobium versatile TaxID=2884831 RepID=A0A953M0S8_9BACT|nr:PAS domain S-box protein [Candidatus Nitrobium versatile]